MTYDALGRLTQVVAGASTTNYTYDALDRLRTINVGSATNRFRYVGTTDSVAQILDNVALTVLTNHATDLDGTELFDFAPGGSSQVYLGRNDHGDVTWSATTTGAVSARVSYDPYGNVAASSGTTPASRWQGSYYDSTSGFYYVNARWYAPSLGTFLSEDPITHEIMDPASRDEYAYGSGDAVDMTDVSGLCGGPGGECSDVTSGLSTPAPSWGMDVTTGYSLGNVQFWRQKDPSWVDRPIVSYARQEALRAKKKTPCTDSLGKSGCFITALAMALDYLHRSQSPNPLTLDSWLNAQTTKGTNSGFINGKSCALSWNSSAMASRLGIKRITKIGVRIWPNTWAQTLTKHGLFQKIAVQLSQGSPVIAEVAPGNPTHFVVITGWTTWSYSGSITGSKREVSSRRYVRAVKGGRRAHYDGTMGDYLINDPEAKKPGTKLFATYGAIINLYKVRRA
jgi:RHS repeat-associated protein